MSYIALSTRHKAALFRTQNMLMASSAKLSLDNYQLLDTQVKVKMSFECSPRHSRRGKSAKKDMTPSSGRARVGGIFRIQGQGYRKHDLEHTADGAAAASGITMASHALPADSETENDEDTNPMLVDELVGINKTLEKQIETLRLRLDFDSRHHEAQKNAILVETGAKLKTKAEEINILKQQISVKDTAIKDITSENEKRDSEINELRRQIEELNNEVDSAKTYANTLVSELTDLTREKERLELEGVFGEKDRQVDALRKQVSELTLNLTTLETELTKARDVITTQNGKIKLMETDKKSLQLKFKEELAKVSHSMRLEVEKMRDVMKKQWEEMRSLREQNMSMSRDIKDIRSLLVNGCLDDDAKVQQQEGKGHQIPQEQMTPQIPVPQTARGGKTVYNSFNMGALKPSLPVLNKDKKGNQRRK